MLDRLSGSDSTYNEQLKEKILKLKGERDAVIIAHNYQRDEVQELADITGDSLALSHAAVRTDAKVIVFCGVTFMAETAAILNPDKIVLLPVIEAGCPMADMITAEKVRALKAQYPDAAVVCYVNSSARVKAESDICCTSSNAIQIVKSLGDYKRVIFIPDRNLGQYVQSQIPDKEIILWKGFCPTHIRVQEEDILEVRKIYPDAEFIAHPECEPEVLALADHICSTGGMFKYVKESKSKRFIIGTESGMLYRLKIENPGKEFFIATSHLICPSMKLTTLGWLAHSLENMVYKVEVAGDVSAKAKQALDRMLAVSGEKPLAATAGY